MAIVEISETQILNALHKVRPERWSEVLGFLEQISAATASQEASARPIRVGTDLAGSGMIGIWADRADIIDSVQYARDLRKQASER